MAYTQDHAEVLLDPYLVAGYLPRDMPLAPALSKSQVTVALPSIEDEITAQLDIDLNATSRWIADPAKLTAAGSELRWHPSQGSDMSPYWAFDPLDAPLVASDYDWRLPNGKKKAYPAFRLHHGAWGELKGFTDGLAGYTVAFVMRIRHPENGGHFAPVFASKVGVLDTDPSSDTRLVFRTGPRRLLLHKGQHHATRRTQDDGRPFIIAVRQDTKESSLVVGDGHHWKHDRFRHASTDSYDMNWYLGRGTPFSRRHTLVCDIVEIVMWDSAISHTHLHHRTRKLNHLYGAVRR